MCGEMLLKAKTLPFGRMDIETKELKGPAHSKNENLYFLAPVQTKRMQPILLSCKKTV